MRSANTPPAREALAVVPVVEETVEVDTVLVETGAGVRVHSRVSERDERVEVPLERDELIIERVPIDRVVSGPPPVQRVEGETLVVPVLEEELVVEKRLRLKEEVRITRRATRTVSSQTVRVRSQHVEVERFDDNPGARHG